MNYVGLIFLFKDPKWLCSDPEDQPGFRRQDVPDGKKTCLIINYFTESTHFKSISS